MATTEHFRRLVHSDKIPIEWASTNPKPKIVMDTRNTDYLRDNVPPKTIIEVGGLHLSACVADHLLKLANRAPVKNGRATIILSRRATESWHGRSGKIESCELWEFEEVAKRVKKETGVTIKIGD